MSQYENSHNKIIAKNTLFLYIRMFVIMIIKLYTTRVLLEVLGIDNFGIWNLVYGVVLALSFISSPLVTSTQRFLNYDQGRGGKNQSEIFSSSLIIIFIIAAIVVLFLETGGSWFVYHKLDYKGISASSVNIIYQCCIFILFINFTRLPFESLIISHEKFSFYAFISTIESILLLSAILILKFGNTNEPLQLYGLLSLMVAICLWLIYYIYAKIKFSSVKFTKKFDRPLVKEMIKFSGWNLFGSTASMASTQGINVLLNIFCGVAVNAAYGVSMQVRGALSHLSDNLVKAANPRIVRAYASKEIDQMMSISNNISKLSFALIFFVSFIAINFIQLILSLWLGTNIPEYTAAFCILSIIQILVVSLMSPIDTVIFSTGDIKSYQITLSCILILNFILSYVFLLLGYSPIVVLIIKCLIEFVVLITRILFVKIKIGYPLTKYFRNVIVPAGMMVISSVIIMGIINYIFSYEQTVIDMLMFSVVYLFIFILSAFLLLLNKAQRKNVVNKILIH